MWKPYVTYVGDKTVVPEVPLMNSVQRILRLPVVIVCAGVSSITFVRTIVVTFL